MGADEQRREIEINFTKKKELQRELNCIKRKLERIAGMFRETANALDRNTTERVEISLDHDFPTLQQLKDLCADHDRVYAELQRTEQFLDSV